MTEPFQGKLELNQAFELNPTFVDWQKGHTLVVIYQRSEKTDLNSLAKTFEEWKKHFALNNSILLITKDLVIEYRSSKNPTGHIFRLPLKVLESKVLPLAGLSELNGPIGFGESINFRF